MHSEAAPPARPDPFLGRFGRSQAEFSGGNEVQLLRGGDALFPAQIEAITQARHEVWLATYIFHDDVAGVQMVQALRLAARRGVRVRVVVDGFGSKHCLDWISEQLQDSGVALAVFRPIDRWWRWFQPGQLRRLHQKLCVVDGELAFVGGINIIDDRNDLNHGLSDTARLDFAVSVRGPVVQPIEQACRAVWTRAWLGRDFSEELVALVRGPNPLRRARTLLRQLRMQGKASDLTPEIWLPPMRAAFVLRDNLRRRRTIENAYVRAIRGARSRVDLMTPYFYPGQAFRRALCDTAARGVQVRLLLQGKVDYRIAGMAASVLYDELLRSGVRIHEYTPAYLHAKVGMVDEDWATVGSSNIDPLSLLLNLEANVIVQDAAFSAQLGQAFEAAFAQSREVTLQSSGHLPGWRGLLRRGLVAWCAYVYLRVAGATGRY